MLHYVFPATFNVTVLRSSTGGGNIAVLPVWVPDTKDIDIDESGT
jgi:hypothetical protein